MDLKSLNKVSLLEKENKPIIKIPELHKDLPYKIIEGKITNSKFGKVVLLELEEHIVFLPKRVTDSYSPFVGHFKEGKYSLVFRGMKDCNKAREAILFEIVEE